MHGYTLEAIWILDSIWVCTEGPMGIHMMPYGYVALETVWVQRIYAILQQVPKLWVVVTLVTKQNCTEQ